MTAKSREDLPAKNQVRVGQASTAGVIPANLVYQARNVVPAMKRLWPACNKNRAAQITGSTHRFGSLASEEQAGPAICLVYMQYRETSRSHASSNFRWESRGSNSGVHPSLGLDERARILQYPAYLVLPARCSVL
jgi:hypothetical protein